ncbi:MAG: fibrillarin-like rRNA/tRNA 2'-O-methyltransferase [Candidatus Micrarchaeota archaeon]
MKEIFSGVFKIRGQFATQNLVTGRSVYGEKRVREGENEYRMWDPSRSKPAAAFFAGLKNFPIKKGCNILYLGIADGTTASHFSDIIGADGLIIGVDIASQPFEKLMRMCEQRENIIPVLADANHPEKYAEYVDEIGGKVDIIYEDLAQKIQADILIKNAERFLKKGGYAIYMVKAPSIDVAAKPEDIFEKEMNKLQKAGFKVLEMRALDSRFQKDHACIVAQYEK